MRSQPSLTSWNRVHQHRRLARVELGAIVLGGDLVIAAQPGDEVEAAGRGDPDGAPDPFLRAPGERDRGPPTMRW